VVTQVRQSAEGRIQENVVPEESCTQMAHWVVQPSSFPGGRGKILAFSLLADLGITDEPGNSSRERGGICLSMLLRSVALSDSVDHLRPDARSQGPR
jgi:hypothetical protein